MSAERRADVQGLRAVAVLLVVGYHAGLPLPGGYTGVDVFFVISGFVITGLLLRREAAGGIELRAFYVRRFRRLTPALALVVLVTLLGSVLLLAPFGTQQVAAKTGAGALLLVANLVIARDTGGYFDAAAGANPLLHTWSLSVEEQFYLGYPALLLLAGRARSRHRTTLVAVAAVSAASFAAMLVGVGRGSDLLGFYSPVARAWEFGAGALLALVAARGVRRPGPALAATAGAAGAAALAATVVLVDATRPFPSLWTLLPVAGTVLLLLAGGAPNPVSRLLAHPVAGWVGDRSYSLYLWHWPAIVAAHQLWPGSARAAFLAAALSALPAAASYRWVEQPWRHRSVASPRRGVALATLVVLVPVAAGVGLRTGAERGWGVDRVVAAQQADSAQRAAFTTCLTQDTTGGAAVDFAGCRSGADRPGRPIVLVGDSNAAMYAEGVRAAGRTLDRPVLVRTAAACAFADVRRGTAAGQDATDRACRRYYTATLRGVLDGPPATVVIAESASQALLAGRSLGATTTTLTDGGGRSAVLTEGLRRTVTRLRAAGHQVVLVLPIAWLGGIAVPVTAAQCPTMLGLLADSCPASFPVADLPADQVALRAAVAAVAVRAGAWSLDPLGAQCPRGRCGPRAGGVAVYGDAGHLSAAFSARLAGRFDGALRAVARSPRTR